MPRTATTACPQPLRCSGVGTSRWHRLAGHAVVALALCWLGLRYAAPYLAACCAACLAALLWFFIDRRSCRALLVNPVRGHRSGRTIHRSWAEVAARCDLAAVDVPSLRKVRASWPRIELIVRPALGQVYGDFEKAAEALRLAFRASQIRVEPAGTCEVSLLLTFGDALERAFEARLPDSADMQPEAVVLGRRADGGLWRLPLGPHTLVAGCSGSGKGSVFWSFAFGLAGASHTGSVQLHGIDLKGGMEILMGEGLFTTLATTETEAVASLERLVDAMRDRAYRYAGRRRSHTATPDEPLHVVMIDELAALTAYCSDRDLQRRAEQALNLLCSQGRAPGFMVFACLQDPRKEVIPSRGLFTQMIGLRLKDLSESTMVLGEAAVASGATCHRIQRRVPGTGYVVPEDGGPAVRVRAGYASDDAIREVASRFSAPSRIEVDASALVEELDARRARRVRSTGAAS